MKQRLELKLGQRLTMTPQLQQAIRLLQLPAVDLRTEIADILASNAMLEELDGDDLQDADSTALESLDTPSGDNSGPDSGNGVEEDGTDWAAHYAQGTGGGNDEGVTDVFAARSEPETLSAHLLWQMHMTPLSDTDTRIAQTLIDAIGGDGYLSVSLEDIKASLLPELNVGIDEIEMVLHQIQNFDPLGVGARSLGECLLLQLRHLDGESPTLAVAKTVCEHHLNLLAGRDSSRLCRVIGCDAETLAAAVALIQSLNPRPGGIIAPQETGYVIPDLIVERRGGRYVAFLAREACPRVRVNPEYEALVCAGARHRDGGALMEQIQEARWFVKSIQNRHDTLLRVGQAIVERQQAWFEQGDQAMIPMILNDIATELELHESTVSRATTQKYMRTPRGIVELKHFFSSRVGAADGDGTSATAIRSMIRALVDAESPQRPISDNRIATLLCEQGIHVARRTVAKYRESMRIPPSSQRKPLVQVNR